MRGWYVNRSSSQEIGTKQPVTHVGIEVILSRSSKRRRGLQVFLAKWPGSALALMSYLCPCVSFHSHLIFYPGAHSAPCRNPHFPFRVYPSHSTINSLQ